MSRIKEHYADQLNAQRDMEPKPRRANPFLAAPPPAPGLWSEWAEHEGVQLLLYFEYDPPEVGSREPMSGLKLEPDYPARVTIVNVYVRDVDIMPLLPFETIDKLEHDLLAERGDDL